MALSTLTNKTKEPTAFVIYPVTPNGVEHICQSLGADRIPKVIYPVTPNGVEHKTP